MSKYKDPYSTVNATYAPAPRRLQDFLWSDKQRLTSDITNGGHGSRTRRHPNDSTGNRFGKADGRPRCCIQLFVKVWLAFKGTLLCVWCSDLSVNKFIVSNLEAALNVSAGSSTVNKEGVSINSYLDAASLTGEVPTSAIKKNDVASSECRSTQSGLMDAMCFHRQWRLAHHRRRGSLVHYSCGQYSIRAPVHSFFRERSVVSLLRNA